MFILTVAEKGYRRKGASWGSDSAAAECVSGRGSRTHCLYAFLSLRFARRVS